MGTDVEGRYVHEALLFESPDDLVGAAAPFLHEGLLAEEAVVLLCTEDHNRMVAEALENDDRVIAVSQRHVYSKAIDAVAFLREFVADLQAGGRARVRLVGEAYFGPDRRSWDEWRRFEALCNRALKQLPLWSLCAYDTKAATEFVMAAVRLTHPYLRWAGTRRWNQEYVDPAEVLRLPGRDRRTPAATEPLMVLTGGHQLRDLRQRLREALEDKPAGPAKVADVVLAAQEAVANALRHGAPPVTVHLWFSPGEINCTITDRGVGFDDPFAGYLPGGAEATPGEGRLGLWIARRLCEELVTTRTPEGFVVRLVIRC